MLERRPREKPVPEEIQVEARLDTEYLVVVVWVGVISARKELKVP